MHAAAHHRRGDFVRQRNPVGLGGAQRVLKVLAGQPNVVELDVEQVIEQRRELCHPAGAGRRELVVLRDLLAQHPHLAEVLRQRPRIRHHRTAGRRFARGVQERRRALFEPFADDGQHDVLNARLHRLLHLIRQR